MSTAFRRPREEKVGRWIGQEKKVPRVEREGREKKRQEKKGLGSVGKREIGNFRVGPY